MESGDKSIKVSVIVAAYNEEKYIGHTLESVLSQNVDFKYEVLVGDDCSSDGTAKVIKEFADNYPEIIIPFIRDVNLGMTENAMDLIRHAKGEYIAFVEGDDYWIDDDKLMKQCEFLDCHRDYVACFGLCTIVDENDKRQKKLEQYSGFLKRGGDYTIKDFEDYLLPGQTATSMYRKKSFEDMLDKLTKSHFDMSRFIDRHMVLIMMADGKLYNSGEEVSAYRYVMNKNSGSWSSKNDYFSFLNLKNYLEVLKELENLASDFGLKLDFDGRRRYEYDKMRDNCTVFTREEVLTIKKTLLDSSNDRSAMNMFMLKRDLKNILKKFVDCIKQKRIEPFQLKPELNYLEYHVAWHCNLKCKGCGHYSNLQEDPMFSDLGQYEKDLGQLHKFVSNIADIRLMGGEPLLNPELGKFIEVTRKEFPHARIAVASNGILIPSCDDSLMRSMKKYRARFDVTCYPPTYKILDKIREKCSKFGVELIVSDLVNEFFACSDGTETSNAKENWENCESKEYHFLYNGKLAVCGLPILSNVMRDKTQYKGIALPDDVVDIYDPEITSEVLIEKMNSPISMCQYCDKCNKKFFKWEGQYTDYFSAQMLN
ncbi:glycosyltransferase [Butyrivibrio sp. FCS006]|uniref:glycosyltransferase n=1 Tax=Butyrivibrio sp. FCS006 TaxID=1280684 RepID=UPI0003FE315D|nr:glycosyltransferase [Butyrivibrio sp. FCS006]